MQRIIAGRSATLSYTFSVDGTATNPTPDAATVAITRADGTVLVATTAATEAGTGIVTYTLSPTQTADLDVLTVTWTATFGAASQAFTERVEIRGDYLFTIEQARRLKPLNDTTAYPTARLVEARTLAESALEDACEVAFVPTYFRVTLDGRGRTDIMLPLSRPLTITSATVDGAAVTVDELGLYDVGRIYNPNGWAAGRRNVVITGTHGYPFAPPRVGRAALLLAKRFLVDSPVSDRTTSITTEDGTTRFITAGERQAVFDVPECNQIVIEYGISDAYAVG